MGLSKEFYRLLEEREENPEIEKEAARLVMSAPEDAESNGLLALMYHDGIGVERDLDKAFDYVEKAAMEDEGVALYLLGFMCENGETPDQLYGGPRQKYDHYDAERFMERCAASSSSWATDACLWLGRYYMNMARGGDPEFGVEFLERIGDEDSEAAGLLCDYYEERLESLGEDAPESEIENCRKHISYWRALARKPWERDKGVETGP